MKETAIEFLVDEFKEKLIGHNLPEWVVNIIQQAKAMEKEQIKDAWEESRIVKVVDTYHEKETSFDDYYNETFKSE